MRDQPGGFREPSHISAPHARAFSSGASAGHGTSPLFANGKIMRQRTITDADLCAYLDNEAPAARVSEIAAATQDNRELRNKLKAWRAQDQWLRALFAPVAQEPVPNFLTQDFANPRAPALLHEQDKMPSLAHPKDETLMWKMIALTLGILLFATALYASGLIPSTSRGTIITIEKIKDQPRSLRGS